MSQQSSINDNCDSEKKIELLLNWSILDDPAIIERCRNSLREDGVMVVRNFATKDGLERLKAEVLSVPCNDSRQHYTPWQDQGDHVNYPSSHPRNFMMHSSAAFVGRKTLEHDTRDRLCVSIYNDGDTDYCDEADLNNDADNNNNRLLRFLSTVAIKKLYKSTDENGSVYSYRVHPEHDAPWHFDESPYTAIIYLQNSEGGGEFEYVPWCRPTVSKDDEKGHETVKRILMDCGKNTDDDDDDSNNYDIVKRRITVEPGSLVFFNGARSFHRAAPITGPSIRLGLVFTYGEKEGFANSDNVKNSNEWDPEDATCMMQK